MLREVRARCGYVVASLEVAMCGVNVETAFKCCITVLLVSVTVSSAAASGAKYLSIISKSYEYIVNQIIGETVLLKY